MPILIRYLNVNKIPPFSQVFLRYIFAFLSAAIYFFIVRKEKIKVAKKDYWLLLFLAVYGYALTNLFFTFGALYTQIGNALFIFYSFSVITPVLAFFVLKEKINKFTAISLGMVILSLVLLFQPNTVSTWKFGGLMAFLAAVGQSVYLVGRRKLINFSSAQLLVISTFVGVITLGILSLFFERSFYLRGTLSQLSGITWLATVIFGVMNFSAWLLMAKGFQLVNAATGGVIMLVENIFAVIFGFFLFAEVPTIYTLFGGLLILVSSSLVILKGEN